jgi:hypothetical protein
MKRTPQEMDRATLVNALIEQIQGTTVRRPKLDEAIARALGFRIAATTRGPHIMREGSGASWDLPAYTATAESRADAIRRLSANTK